MKTVSAVCVYDNNNTVYNLSFIHKTNIIPMIYGNAKHENDKKTFHKFKSFHEIYQTILQIAKNNDCKIPAYFEFDCLWYDIKFINIDNPGMIDKYGYKA